MPLKGTWSLPNMQVTKACDPNPDKKANRKITKWNAS